ncbi:MAG: hypothetical protein QOG85_959 [Gaiellaceae bacterium]|jgi:hypothetical protein|nr:hypothetical protein [Gaiellaceae bacterium]
MNCWNEGLSGTRVEPTPKGMKKRGLQLLEAHLRSLDPSEPTAHERLEQAMGVPLTRHLERALRTNGLPPRRDILAA